MAEMSAMETVNKNNNENGPNKEKNKGTEEESQEEAGSRGSLLKDLEGDKMHVLVLFFLYVLQGIPLGLINAIPLVLTNRSVPYSDQAFFSLSGYPFSMKLLWAPLVDSVYIKRIGRRKSWLVPTQYLIGFLMLFASQRVGRMLGDSEDPEETLEPDITGLTVLFFFLNFLAATQDVAVDGWALTMLRPENVGYASTCNSVGQTTGWCLGYILYTSLEGYGVITLDQFLFFWGIVFLVTTTLILFFKKEKNAVLPLCCCEKKEDDSSTNNEVSPDDEVGEPELGIVDTYKILWKMVRHPLIPVVIFWLLTAGFAYSAAEEMTNLKLIERGVPKEKIAMLAIPMIPVKILFTLFITRFTVGPRPLNVWLLFYPLRLAFCLAMVLLVFLTPMFAMEDEDGKSFSTAYYVSVIGVFALHRVAVYAMFVAGMAFKARISDPVVGGTYMTFLNTLTNLGNKWPESLSLWVVDLVTIKNCIQPLDSSKELNAPLQNLERPSNASVASLVAGGNVCYGSTQVDACKGVGGECSTLTDGYFGLSIACVVIGFVWFVWCFRTVRRLQLIKVSEWRVVGKEEGEKEREATKKFKFFYCF